MFVDRQLGAIGLELLGGTAFAGAMPAEQRADVDDVRGHAQLLRLPAHLLGKPGKVREWACASIQPRALRGCDPESGIWNSKGVKNPKENKKLQFERCSPLG
jgi:hypothetical protein